jgi:hypothetical protein
MFFVVVMVILGGNLAAALLYHYMLLGVHESARIIVCYCRSIQKRSSYFVLFSFTRRHIYVGELKYS